MRLEGRAIRVRGLVQGVGFRPHVWRLARVLGLVGHVANDGEGVAIIAWGSLAQLAEFATRLTTEAPPLARIDAMEQAAHTGAAPVDFTILASHASAPRTAIVPDAATCPACRAELFDPADRRHGYAFGNCTHCGPRLTIIRAIPYDRANTAMAPFAMCATCAAEYADPADRRFHAQPTACPACGPKLWFEGGAGDDPLADAAQMLRAGAIVAIKGIGGFHLACDALNPAAVALLRQRKARDAKPFALMAGSLAEIRRFCDVSPDAAALLSSPAAPIVLLPLRRGGEPLPAGIAPGQDHVGFMLAYAPLHHLLLAARDGPLVMTSANHADEPQVTTNEAAREGLAGLADGWLMHDRDIVNRLDDSVMALAECGPVPIRRARGFAPAPIRLHPDFAGLPPVLAMGGELKATFCLLRDGEAVVSQHIGDLEDAAALGDYRAMLALYRNLFDFTPAVVAVDAHADYLSAQAGAALAKECGARLVRVAHHHAHYAACLADAGLGMEAAEGTLGLMFDGLGLGPDGTLWGGELLAGGYAGARRVGGIVALPLPGGAAAMKQPWRNLVAHLRGAFGAEWLARAGAVAQHLPPPATLNVIERMIDSATNCPPCSSAGRLFDAVAAALGLFPQAIGHEAQAAMALEACARRFVAGAGAYPAAEQGGVISWGPMWGALLGDLAAGVEAGAIAARFHNGFVDALVRLTAARAEPGTRVALSGGVMQNRIVLDGLVRGLRKAGLVPLAHGQVPANDGGLALGQAVIGGLMANKGVNL